MSRDMTLTLEVLTGWEARRRRASKRRRSPPSLPSILSSPLSSPPAEPARTAGLCHIYEDLGLITQFLAEHEHPLVTRASAHMQIALRRARRPDIFAVNVSVVVHSASACWRFCVCHVASWKDMVFVYDRARHAQVCLGELPDDE
jgi:hypothetical protein